MMGTILLVEDNEQNRYLATFLLERHGYSVISAADGCSAVELAAKLIPMGILLDIQLPGMDGYAVARALRDEPQLDAVPIVAVTSYAMPGDRERALAAGCNGYIEKPIEPENFASQIQSILSSSAASGSP